MSKQALGKGLGALIRKNANPAPAAMTADESTRVREVPLDMVVPSPLQPRSQFVESPLDDLMESIRTHGIIQPLIVRPVNGRLELIAGERRWRASNKLGLATVPVIERQATDREVLEMALIENLQREDLNPMEEAAGYVRLAKEFSMKQEEIATQVGKSRASVANAMRLLDLHPDVQSLLKHGQISVGHAKVLLSLKAQDEQKWLAEQIIRQGASVRVAEKMATDHLTKSGRTPNKRNTPPPAPALAPALQRIQNLLVHHIGTDVTLQHRDKHGTIRIEYYGTADLNRILDVLKITDEPL